MGWLWVVDTYGVAMSSRLLKIISLFCRISSLLYGPFAKEPYNFKEPTNRSHPIHVCTHVHECIHEMYILCWYIQYKNQIYVHEWYILYANPMCVHVCTRVHECIYKICILCWDIPYTNHICVHVCTHVHECTYQNVQPIAFGVSFLLSSMTIDDPVHTVFFATLNRDQRDWDSRLRLSETSKAIGCIYCVFSFSYFLILIFVFSISHFLISYFSFSYLLVHSVLFFDFLIFFCSALEKILLCCIFDVFDVVFLICFDFFFLSALSVWWRCWSQCLALSLSPQLTATHCNALQHTATHRTTSCSFSLLLWHTTATHCNMSRFLSLFLSLSCSLSLSRALSLASARARTLSLSLSHSLSLSLSRTLWRALSLSLSRARALSLSLSRSLLHNRPP